MKRRMKGEGGAGAWQRAFGDFVLRIDLQP